MERPYRLRARREFQLAYKYGQTLANRQLAVYVRQLNEQKQRFGITASKKVGNAVVRNRMRRVMKEILRLNRNDFLVGYDYVFIVRAAAVQCNSEQLKASIYHLLRKLKFLQEHAVKQQLAAYLQIKETTSKKRTATKSFSSKEVSSEKRQSTKKKPPH